MKENNDIDELFRSGLEGQRMTPSEKSWNKLDSALSAKQSARRRKKRNRFLFLSLFLLLITYPAYKFLNRNNDQRGTISDEVNSEFIKNGNKSSETITGNSAMVTEQNGAENSQTPISDSGEDPVSEELQSAQSAASVQPVQNVQVPGNDVKVNQRPVKDSEKIQPEIKTISALQPVKEKSSVAVVSKPVSAQTTVQNDMLNVETTENVVVDEDVLEVKEPNILPEENKLAQVDVVAKQDNLSEEKINSKDVVPVISEQREEKKTEIAVTTGEIAKTETEIEAPANKNDNIFLAPEMGQSPQGTNENVKDPSHNVETKSSEQNKANENTNANMDSSKVNDDYISARSEKTNKPLLKRILSNISIGAYYSPDYVKNRFKINEEYTGTASQDEDDYDNIKAAFSYSTGAFLRYDIGSRWSIGSGISYSTFSQTAVYNTINVVVDSVYRNVHGHNEGPRGGSGGGGGGHGGGGGGHGGPGGGGSGGGGGGHGGGHQGNNPHNPPGGGNGNHFVVNTPCGAIDLYNVPPHHHSGNIQNGDTLNIKTETSESIHFINIPLTVRYNFGKGKWSIFVETGASLNIVNSNKVRITVNDAYTEDNEHDGLKKLSYSLILGAGIQYNFYKNLSLFLNPSFRYSITPINQYNPMDSYPYFIGAGGGMSIHF